MISNLTLSQDVFNTPDICTKMKIMHAVDKSLDRVTISEICEKAGISRQTFYRHFKSKYDIPWWFSIFCRQFYLNEIGRTIDWRTGYYHHIRLIATERDFFRKSIQYSINTPFGQTIMPQNRKVVLLETLQSYRHVPVDHNMQFLVETFSKLECEVLNDWFRSDADTDLVVWTDDLVSLVPIGCIVRLTYLRTFNADWAIYQCFAWRSPIHRRFWVCGLRQFGICGL